MHRCQRHEACVATSLMFAASFRKSRCPCFIRKFISKCRVSIPECDTWILTVNTGLLSKSVPPYSRMRGVCLLQIIPKRGVDKITLIRRRAEGGRSLSRSDSNGFCLPPSGRSHSVSVIRMHGESLRLNIVQASFSTDETMTHCGLIEQVSHIAAQIIFSSC